MNAYLPDSFKALEKAQDAVETAKYNLQGAYFLAAINRAYYAMFYCMTALLNLRNVHAKTHSGVQSKFRELYVLNGTFDLSISKRIQDCFNIRQEVDYDLDAQADRKDAEDAISAAEEFFGLTKSYLGGIQ